jgi:hypothetical protein
MFDGEKNSFRNAANKKETDNYPTQVELIWSSE